MSSQKLRYLFVAQFSDGSSFAQTPEDVSEIDTQRSCFYDVLQSGKKVVKFSLRDGVDVIAVDLRTGLFWVNGVRVLLESEKLPTLPDEFKLIYYHQVTQNLLVTYKKADNAVLDVEQTDDSGFREYFIGWECTIAGKTYKQKIGVH